MNEFNSKLSLLAKVLSKECTKFSIAHSSPPFPEADVTKNLAGLVCNSASHLVGSYLSLPEAVGSTFLKILFTEIENLVVNLKQFIECIQGIVLRRWWAVINFESSRYLLIEYCFQWYSEKVETGLISTGILWEFCDRIATLPKTNVEAVALTLHKEQQLIKDGLEELNEVRITTKRWVI